MSGPRIAAATLADLPIGATGTILDVVGDDVLAARLLELGLTPGAEVVLLRRAPLGGALLVRVRDYALSMRRDEAIRVSITTTTLTATTTLAATPTTTATPARSP